MKKMMPFEKSMKDKKSDKGMKESSKADMLKDKMMMKKKMARGGMAPVVMGKPDKSPMSSGPSRSPRGAMTGGAKPMGAMGGIKKGMYRKGGMCK